MSKSEREKRGASKREERKKNSKETY